MDADRNEVLFETWLYKLSGLNNEHSKSLSKSWKKRYFVLLREGTSASLLYYVRKPKNEELNPKGYIQLQPYYKILKRPRMKGKSFVCELITEKRRLLLATEDVKIFHLFYFFMQVQTKIRDDLQGKCFVVRPDNTEDQRKLGATANISLLHVSQWGITLALELSRCVLAQWPLNCIKVYDCSGTGQFSFETGRRSPTGEGHYMFRTRQGHDKQIFEMLDKYVDKASAIQEQLLSSRSSAINDIRGSVCDSEMELQQVTYVFSDAAFTNHLQRISRNIYDHLLTHIGGSNLSFRNLSDGDSVIGSRNSSGSQRVNSPYSSKTSSPVKKAPATYETPSPSAASRNEAGPPMMTKISKVAVPSQYLHMAEVPPEENNVLSAAEERYVNISSLRNREAEPQYSGIPDAISRSCDELRDCDAPEPPHSYHNWMFESSTDDDVNKTTLAVAAADFCSLSRKSKQEKAARRERQRKLRRSVSNPDLLESNDTLAMMPSFRDRAAALKLRLLPFTSQTSMTGESPTGGIPLSTSAPSSATGPAKQSALSRSASAMKETRFTNKSRSFVKQASLPEVLPTGADVVSPPITGLDNVMEGRQLPNLPTAAPHTFC